MNMAGKPIELIYSSTSFLPVIKIKKGSISQCLDVFASDKASQEVRSENIGCYITIKMDNMFDFSATLLRTVRKRAPEDPFHVALFGSIS